MRLASLTLASCMTQLFNMENATWSWVVSIFAVGGIIGGMIGGPITGTIGPKWCQLGNNVLWIAAGLVQAFAPPGSSAGIPMLMVGRALAGVAAGACCAAGIVGRENVRVASSCIKVRAYIDCAHTNCVHTPAHADTVPCASLSQTAHVSVHTRSWSPFCSVHMIHTENYAQSAYASAQTHAHTRAHRAGDGEKGGERTERGERTKERY